MGFKMNFFFFDKQMNSFRLKTIFDNSPSIHNRLLEKPQKWSAVNDINWFWTCPVWQIL